MNKMKKILLMTNFINLTEIQQYMNYKINNGILAKLDELELSLKNNESLSLTEKFSEISKIIDNYRYNINFIISDNNVKNKIKDEYRCESKTITNERCSRKKIQNELYCKSHNVYRPFGRYDEVAIEKEKMININLIDKKLYIESIKFKYDDKSFLIDMNGIIYTIDTCLIVGRQLNDEIIWF